MDSFIFSYLQLSEYRLCQWWPLGNLVIVSDRSPVKDFSRNAGTQSNAGFLIRLDFLYQWTFCRGMCYTQLVKKVFRRFLRTWKVLKNLRKTPLMGFFRNYLPFRWRKISGFFDNYSFCRGTEARYLYLDFLKSLHKSGQQPEKFVALSHCAALSPVL